MRRAGAALIRDARGLFVCVDFWAALRTRAQCPVAC